MERQLILLGTIHSDPQGKPRLLRALREYDPENITFELIDATYNPFSREERKKLSDLTFELTGAPSHPYQRRVLEGLLQGYGYEEVIASRLERSKKRGIYRIDLEISGQEETRLEGKTNCTTIRPALGKQATQQLEQLAIANFVYQRLEEVGGGGSLGEILAEYASYTYFSTEELKEIMDYKYARLLKETAITPDKGVSLRDQAMEQRIREIWSNSEGTLVHISGLYHVYGDYHNLFERLRDLNPERHRLNEFQRERLKQNHKNA